MGNKSKYIKQANLLLEKRYLGEQNPPSTGSTQPTTGSTQPTSGATPTQKVTTPSNSSSEMSPKQTNELNKIKGLSPDKVKSNYLKCSGNEVGDVIKDTKFDNWGFKIHKFGDSFCIG